MVIFDIVVNQGAVTFDKISRYTKFIIKKGYVMSTNEEFQESNEIPILAINGLIGHCQNSEYFKCSMCGQIFKKSEEDPIGHSMLCTGF